ncbi:unnamed protein product [Boreogadus saida]
MCIRSHLGAEECSCVGAAYLQALPDYSGRKLCALGRDVLYVAELSWGRIARHTSPSFHTNVTAQRGDAAPFAYSGRSVLTGQVPATDTCSSLRME